MPNAGGIPALSSWARKVVKVLDERAQRLQLFGGKFDEPDAKPDRRLVVRHFSPQFEPFAGGQAQFESQHFADGHLAEGIHVATAVRKIGDTCCVVPTLAVPNSVKRNV